MNLDSQLEAKALAGMFNHKYLRVFKAAVIAFFGRMVHVIEQNIDLEFKFCERNLRESQSLKWR